MVVVVVGVLVLNRARLGLPAQGALPGCEVSVRWLLARAEPLLLVLSRRVCSVFSASSRAAALAFCRAKASLSRNCSTSAFRASRARMAPSCSARSAFSLEKIVFAYVQFAPKVFSLS